MIGIITYISVLERTKEIGILRSVGASKRDVSRVFKAETIIVGFAAGLIGIGVTILLNLPISIIAEKLTGISGIAVLPVPAAVILVIISVVLYDDCRPDPVQNGCKEGSGHRVANRVTIAQGGGAMPPPIKRPSKEKSPETKRFRNFSGAASQIRTGDLILTKDALYLLSYSSVSDSFFIILTAPLVVKHEFWKFPGFFKSDTQSAHRRTCTALAPTVGAAWLPCEP